MHRHLHRTGTAQDFLPAMGNYRLLPLYEYCQGDDEPDPAEIPKTKGFVFCPGFSARRRSGSNSTSPASTEAAARVREGNTPR